MGTVRRRRGFAYGAAVVAALGAILLAVAGGAVGSNTASSSAAAKQTKVAGGTAYFAEGAQAVPNYIFPFMSLAYFSVTNISDLQQLMYRPLYWFGQGSSPGINPSLSLAALPTYSDGGRKITIHMKPYKWSNGETVTAQDTVFFMNMDKVEKQNWAGYAPGTMPDDVKSVIATNPTTLVFTLTGPANSNWFTYNELSQITPIPMAWDVSKAGEKAGSESCGKAAATPRLSSSRHLRPPSRASPSGHTCRTSRSR